VETLSSVSGLAELQNAAWPGLITSDSGSWLYRSASGVTQRANSVWPYAPVEDLDGSIKAAEAWYRGQRLPALFQLTSDPADAGLDLRLEALGYRVQTPTLFMVRDGSVVPSAVGTAAVELRRELTEEWFDAWWLTSGHGGAEAAGTARAIQESGRSSYALVRDDDGAVAAVGQAIHVGAFSGIYGMATREAHRRRGHSRAILSALLAEAGTAEGFWLSVTRTNQGALRLYRDFGFVEAGSYWYRSAPLRRAPGAC